MPIRVDAYVLLGKATKPDFDVIATEIEWRYPQIGKVRIKRGGAADQQTAMMIEGASVELGYVAAPYPPEQLLPPSRTIGYDQDAVTLLARRHASYVVISVSAQKDGLEWARAYAALVTLVASAVAGATDAVAVFWPDSWVSMPPAKFEEAAGDVLRGQSPIAIWLAFAEANPARLGGEGMRGIASLGLRKFVGRELELAPMPAAAGDVLGCVREAARQLLSGAWSPEDGQNVTFDPIPQPLVLRVADEGFLRPGLPALVLVGPEAAVEAETLTRKGGGQKAPGAGLIGRLFKRG